MAKLLYTLGEAHVASQDAELSEGTALPSPHCALQCAHQQGGQPWAQVKESWEHEGQEALCSSFVSVCPSWSHTVSAQQMEMVFPFLPLFLFASLLYFNLSQLCINACMCVCFESLTT